MGLTPEERALGRRTFLKAVVGPSALAALGTTAAIRGPIWGGPVRAALIGHGRQGQVLRDSVDPDILDLVAICDIQQPQAGEPEGAPGPKGYRDWRQMLQHEDIEAVLVATPLSTHADIAVGCFEAGKHVFCETAMARDATGCDRMLAAAATRASVLQIGYQDQYEPLYSVAQRAVLQQGLLGDVYTLCAAWHSGSSGRVERPSPPPDVDLPAWGYASWDELVNWRLYRRHSGGLMTEWGGGLVYLMSWFLNATPVAVQASGGIYAYRDGRDVDDHVYVTLEYPHGRIATLSLIQSSELEGSYTQFMGTKGTLILSRGEALLFPDGEGRPAELRSARRDATRPVLEASASRGTPALNASALPNPAEDGARNSIEALFRQLAAFCGAIRTGSHPPDQASRALEVALTCFAVEQAIREQRRVSVPRAQRA